MKKKRKINKTNQNKILFITVIIITLSENHNEIYAIKLYFSSRIENNIYERVNFNIM